MSNSEDGGAKPPSVQGDVDAAVEDDKPANNSAEEGTAHPQKKRRRQDDDPEASDKSNELNEEGEKRTDPSKRVKVSEPSAASADKGGNLASEDLAAAASSETPPSLNDGKETTKPQTFGSSAKSAVSFGSLSGAAPGFGSLASNGLSFGAGFGAASGFGAVSNASSDNAGGVGMPKAFGSGFGSSSAGFGSVAADAPSGGSGFAGTFAQQKPKEDESPKIFEEDVDTNNGEENETCICQVRAKLYRMVWVQEKRADEGRSADKTPSVPSIKGRLGDLNKAKTDGDDNNEAGNGDQGLQPKGKLVQKEAGKGPVRILKRKPTYNGSGEEDDGNASPARLVQRQETTGGQATKVIVNVRLIPKQCSVNRLGEKFVQLNAPSGKAEVERYLFKLGTVNDAKTFESKLKEMLGVET